MWVNMSHDFGLPYVTLTVGIRKMYADGIHFAIVELTNEAALDKLAKELQAYVVKHRPKLEGCQVVGINCWRGMQLRITVVHPSLPMVKMGNEPPEEHLELCAACGKAMDADKFQYITAVPCRSDYSFREIVVCDEACAKKLSEPML